MIHMIIGAAAMAVLLLLVDYSRRNTLQVSPWTWGLTVLGLLFAIFTVEVVVGFLAEGAGQAALVIGVILGLFTAIWATLLGRFAFSPSTQ